MDKYSNNADTVGADSVEMDDTVADGSARVVSPDILSREIEVAFGRNRRDMNWVNAQTTVGKLLQIELARHKGGEKDGRCLLQGGLKGSQRLAKAVTKNHLVLVDVDNGQALDEIAGRIEAAGLFAHLWTTHSHGKGETAVAESTMLRFIKKHKLHGADVEDLSSSNSIEAVSKFLETEKRYTPAILNSVSGVTRRHDDDGMKWVVAHAPMDRVRVLFVLDEPYDFSVGGTQDARIKEWSERYAGFSESLGIAYDRSCVDPSRLMYLPRCKAGEAANHRIVTIPGRALTRDDMTTDAISAEKTTNAVTRFEALGAKYGKSEGKRVEFKTPGLVNWLYSGKAATFAAAGFLQTYAPDDIRKDEGEKVTARCPFEGNHSKGDGPVDMGFYAVNGAGADGEGFKLRCSHDGCKSAHDDRMVYLDAMCVELGVGVEELNEFCGETEEEAKNKREVEEAARKAEETKSSLSALIAALTTDSDGATVDKVIAELAKLPEFSETDDLITEVRSATRRPKKDLERNLRKARKEVAKAAKKAARAKAENTLGDHAPVPDKPEKAGIIWGHWSNREQCQVAVMAFSAKNAKDPSVFVRRDASKARVNKIDDKVLLSDVPAESSAWHAELTDRIEFKHLKMSKDEDGKITYFEVEADPFDNVVKYFCGSKVENLSLPVIDKIVRVPVFGPDGQLRTKRGYDKDLKVWLETGSDYLPVPDVVTDEHLDTAWWYLTEAVCDMPFADTFGADVSDLPQYLDEKDADGHPLYNPERGRASRLTFFASILQPFVRAMIEGPCPVYHYDKPEPGVGASLLIDVLALITTGQVAGVRDAPESMEEFGKRVASALYSGDGLIAFDNVNHRLDNGGFAVSMTAGQYKCRLLGTNTEMDIAVTQTVVLAGNNMTMSPELARRMGPLYIDPAVPDVTGPRPVEFKYPDLRGWVSRHHRELVWSCHVLIKNWIQKGRKPGSARMASFENYAGVMSGIFEAAGVPPGVFLGNRAHYMATRDEEKGESDKVVAHLYGKLGSAFFQASEARNACTLGLRSDLIMFPDVITGKDEVAQSVSMGLFLKGKVGRTFNVKGVTVKLTRARDGGHDKRGYRFASV